MVFYGGKHSANPVEDRMIRKLDKQSLFKDKLFLCRGNDKRAIVLPEFGTVTLRISNGQVKLYETSETKKIFN